jgi:hypothetical protein
LRIYSIRVPYRSNVPLPKPCPMADNL